MCREHEKADTKEIEVTPEMIEAASYVVYELGYQFPEETHAEIYKAMERARRSKYMV